MVAEATVNCVELSMIPRVEALHAELQPAATCFAESEALEERQVPVVAARTSERVVPEGAELSLCRRGKGSFGNEGQHAEVGAQRIRVGGESLRVVKPAAHCVWSGDGTARI